MSGRINRPDDVRRRRDKQVNSSGGVAPNSVRTPDWMYVRLMDTAVKR